MGACGVAALVVLLLASALLPTTASSRVLEGEASSGEGAPAPTTVGAGGSPKSGSSKESGQSSPAGQQEAPPPTTVTKDSKQPSTGEGEKKGHAEGGAQASATSPPPPPPVKKKDGKESPSPPPGASGPNGGGEGKGGTAGEDKGSKGKDEATDKLKEVMDKCDASHNCTVGEEFFACLQVPDNAATESVVIVLNKGQNLITVNVKESPGIEDIDRKTFQLAKGAYKQMVIKNISPHGGNITLYNEHGDCSLHVSQSVSDLQRQFQQFAKYATRLNPIYGAYLFGFTIVLVGVVCLCCKFARRRGNGVSYQQLEMSAPAPNSSGADNTISTANGWDDGWDDDWDDEEAPARPPDKKPASSVSANGLSLRSHTDNKDGWDVDWDD